MAPLFVTYAYKLLMKLCIVKVLNNVNVLGSMYVCAHVCACVRPCGQRGKKDGDKIKAGR